VESNRETFQLILYTIHYTTRVTQVLLCLFFKCKYIRVSSTNHSGLKPVRKRFQFHDVWFPSKC
jgi:hypothetical protein